MLADRLEDEDITRMEFRDMLGEEFDESDNVHITMSISLIEERKKDDT